MGCSTTDSGNWKVVGGTGIFSSAKGNGSLVGTYFTNDGRPPSACDNDGINDRYVGRLKL